MCTKQKSPVIYIQNKQMDLLRDNSSPLIFQFTVTQGWIKSKVNREKGDVAFNGVCIKQAWITTKRVLPSMTAKHSHYHLETIACG